MLVLHPTDPQGAPQNVAALLSALRDLGLIGAPFSFHGHSHYAAGPRFLELVSFLGCMPFLVLDPAEGLAGQSHAFCHVAVPEPGPEPVLRTAKGTVAPPCPACGARPDSWQAWLGVDRDTRLLTCPSCAERFAPAALRWRRSAAYARIWVDIWGVHPSEAVPTQALLSSLATVSGSPWDYAYLQDPPAPGAADPS